jgi:hypothetical protein
VGRELSIGGSPVWFAPSSLWGLVQRSKRDRDPTTGSGFAPKYFDVDIGGIWWDMVGSGGIWWWDHLIPPDPGNWWDLWWNHLIPRTSTISHVWHYSGGFLGNQ